MKEVEPKDQAAVNKNKTRKHIKALLKDRNLLTFVRPIMGQEHKLTRIEELSYDELRPEFRDSVSRFLQLVQQNLKPKLIAGKGITGKMFVQLTNEYLKAFNTGDCPEILPALEIVIQKEANTIQEEKTKVYLEAWALKTKELVNAKDAKDVLPAFNGLVAKLDSDLWTLATKRQNFDLFWIPREKIVKELRSRLDSFLDEIAEKKKNMSVKVKTKFAESLVPPSQAPLADYFSVGKIKEFHKGMIGWLDKALARESGPNTPNVASDLVGSVCDYYEKFIETGNLVIQLELEKRQDQLELVKCSEEELTKILQDQQR